MSLPLEGCMLDAKAGAERICPLVALAPSRLPMAPSRVKRNDAPVPIGLGLKTHVVAKVHRMGCSESLKIGHFPTRACDVLTSNKGLGVR